MTVLLVLLLVLPVLLSCGLTVKAVAAGASTNLYVGVDVAYESVTATEQLIDNISSYTNFFVIGCTGNYNETRLTLLSQYIHGKGMSFIVYSDNPDYPSPQWFENAQNMWGTSFLGIYYFDEPGGKQIDQTDYPAVTSATNYSDAASEYVDSLNWMLHGEPFSVTKNFAYPTEYKLFTSDYALYWYDYKSGYDVVFAEFGWNYSRQLNVALCRGAAAAFNKDWGVMIDWTYRQVPYIESGPELYDDMVLAYQNGAKYIVVFDTDQNYTQNILQLQQLDAMKQFWQYAQNNPRTITPVGDRTAYVLPPDYGFGFRGPQDKIWGLWNADLLTTDISMSVATLLQMDDTKLDIVYPDGPQTVESSGYSTVVYWNDTRLIPQPTPMPHPQQDTSLMFHTPAIYFYTLAAIIVFAVAVTSIVLKFSARAKKFCACFFLNELARRY